MKWAVLDWSAGAVGRAHNGGWTLLAVLLAFCGSAQGASFSQILSVSASGDDAEQQAGDYFSITSSDLELVVSALPQRVGIRFVGLDVPRGALVSSARIQFTVDEASSGAVAIDIYAEAADDAAAFSVAADVLSRPATSGSLVWSPADWPVVGATGPDQQTPDLAALVQEVVDRPGWARGNALVLLFEGSGVRVAESFDGSQAGAPALTVEWIVSDQEVPVVDAGADQTITMPDAALLDGSVADDGLPVPPGQVTSLWSLVSGAGTVTFVDDTAEDTSATFSAAGTYLLRLSANDGELIGTDTVTITVDPAPVPPSVDGFSPTSAQVAMVVVLSGENFSNAEEVMFNGIPAGFRVLDDSTIHATIPPGGASGLISVRNPWGTALTSAPFALVSSPPVLVGAGDIADCTGNEDQTADLLDGIPGTVIALGDLAYESGTTAEFNNCYEPTWGRHKTRTRPVPGNHEYKTAGAASYYQYFGPSAGDPGRGYYSYDVGSWHVVALNSECAPIGGCDAGSDQAQWLREDLASHPNLCTVAYWHHPRFSSSLHGSDPTYVDLWQILYDAGVELVLSGHDHAYERFAPQDALGNVDQRGVRAFVVGTGGRSFYDVGDTVPNSEIVNDTTHGVLKLTLNAGSYDWEFVPVAGGTFTDSGSDLCHSVNQTPVVDAGQDQSIDWRADAQLTGSATDDGFPNPPGSLAISWSQSSGPEPATFDNAAALSTGVNLPQAGQYQFRLTADDGEFAVSDEVRVTALDGGSEIRTIEVDVPGGGDDVEENRNTGGMYLDSSDLELVLDPTTAVSDQIIGIRFQGVDIPAGASILSARVQFQVDEASTVETNLQIRGDLSANAAPFQATNGHLSGRTRTQMVVPWAPPPWPAVGAAGADQQTPELSAIVQEIVDLPGWTLGNALVFIIDGSGRRVAESFDGLPNAAARLTVEYLVDVNQPPVVNILQPGDGTDWLEGAVITFSGTASDLEDEDLSGALAWQSSLDGSLGIGSTVGMALSVGTHTVTASITDSGGRSGEAQIDLTVRPAPVDVPDVTGMTQASAEDAIVSGGLTVGAVTMASSTVPAGQVISQSPGPCTGCTAAGAAVDLVISSGEANSVPVVSIDSPSDGSIVAENQVVILSGTVLDSEEGGLESALVWRSSKDGELGIGASINVNLTRGRHTITASVTDGGGLSDSETISVRVRKIR